MNEIIYKFVNRCPVALLLDVQDSGTRNLERTAPLHVDIYNSFQEIDQNRYEALIIVSPSSTRHNPNPLLSPTRAFSRFWVSGKL